MNAPVSAAPVTKARAEPAAKNSLRPRKSFYFDKFEHRTPPAPQAPSPARELLYRSLALGAVLFGLRYLYWRWSASINFDALWFSLPLVVAESLAFVGSLLLFSTTWTLRDSEAQTPPARMSECVDDFSMPPDDRGLSVDIFITTLNEDVELVRKSIQSAKRVRVPGDTVCHIHVLDDGARASMRRVAKHEGVSYIERHNSVGYKAGNLRHALLQTSGDFIVICDADTRLFPNYLESTLGYFRDPRVSWVQTPQWFFDIPSGRRLSKTVEARWGPRAGRLAARVESWIGPVYLGRDPLGNDPSPFYDVILRRRNHANASFCCGAASIHRREAVMRSAVRRYARSLQRSVEQLTEKLGDGCAAPSARAEVIARAFGSVQFMPYQFDVSEDIYTSLLQHADRECGWRSVYHPYVLSKMLSPQTLHAWLVQQFKYAGGTLHLAATANPLTLPGLTWRQRLAYTATVWSYLAGTWNLVLLMAPIVYLTTGVSPVISYSHAFVWHIAPFLVLNQLAMMLLFWGIPAYRSTASYLANFSLSLRALWFVARRRKIRFRVTPKTALGPSRWMLAWPQFLVVGASIAALGFALIRAGTCATFGYSFAGLVVNGFWITFNVWMLSGRIRAALHRPSEGSS